VLEAISRPTVPPNRLSESIESIEFIFRIACFNDTIGVPHKNVSVLEGEIFYFDRVRIYNFSNTEGKSSRNNAFYRFRSMFVDTEWVVSCTDILQLFWARHLMFEEYSRYKNSPPKFLFEFIIDDGKKFMECSYLLRLLVENFCEKRDGES
jgi:hypothetical protein